MGVEPKIGGKPPKWMVKIMENLIKIDDLGVPIYIEWLLQWQISKMRMIFSPKRPSSQKNPQTQQP